MNDTKFTPYKEEIVKEMSEVHDKYMQAQSAVFDKGMKQLFDLYPQIHAVRWEQYYPYFNDGDACVFSIHTVSLSTKIKEDEYIFWEEDEEYEEPYREELIGLEWDINQFLSWCLDFLESKFGEHARVTATRDGYDIEEYTEHN